MAQFMKANGKMLCGMGKALRFGRMGVNTLVNGSSFKFSNYNYLKI